MKKLDVTLFDKGFKWIKIGELSDDVIDLLGIDRRPCDIVLWEDRLKYIEKHMRDYNSKEEYDKHIALIPEIISNPDYIARHPSKNSIEYIKKIDKLTIVAIRLKSEGRLALRTVFPLSEKQLANYIKSGTALKISRS